MQICSYTDRVYRLFSPHSSSVSVSDSALQSGTSAAKVVNSQRANVVEKLGKFTAEAYAMALPDREDGQSTAELHQARLAACENFIAIGTFDDWLSEEDIMGLLTLRGHLDGGPPCLRTHTAHTQPRPR